MTRTYGLAGCQVLSLFLDEGLELHIAADTLSGVVVGALLAVAFNVLHASAALFPLYLELFDFSEAAALLTEIRLTRLTRLILCHIDAVVLAKSISALGACSKSGQPLCLEFIQNVCWTHLVDLHRFGTFALFCGTLSFLPRHTK